MRIARTILGLVGGLAMGSALAGDDVANLLAEAEKELKAAQAVGHEWKLIPSGGGSSKPLSKLLAAAKKAHEAGDNDKAMKIAKRVLEAAKLGQQQAAEQENISPHYN